MIQNLSRLFALFLALLILLSAAACQPSEDSEESGEAISSSEEAVADENFPVEVGGIHLKRAPTSVVSLSPSLTELICDLGYSESLTGVSDYCSQGNDRVSGLATCGTSASPDLDAIRQAAPNVVLTTSALPEKDVTALQQMNADVIVLARASSMEELSALYQNVGRVFEGEQAGTQAGLSLYEEQAARLDGIRAAVQAATEGEPLEAAYLRVFPLTLATGDTFEGALLEAMGFENSAFSYTGWSYPEDKAIDLMPDILFYDKAIGKDAVTGSQIYNTTPCFSSGKYFEVDMDKLERQSVAMFDLLEEMARQALPEAFPEDG